MNTNKQNVSSEARYTEAQQALLDRDDIEAVAGETWVIRVLKPLDPTSPRPDSRTQTVFRMLVTLTEADGKTETQRRMVAFRTAVEIVKDGFPGHTVAVDKAGQGVRFRNKRTNPGGGGGDAF